MKILSDEEISDVLRYLRGRGKKGERELLIFSLACFSGLRNTEIRTMEWKSVCQGNRVLQFFTPTHAKRGSKMPALMNRISGEILERWQPINRYLFGKVVRVEAIWKSWQRLQERIWGFASYSFHDLRHTAITNFYVKSRDIEATRQFARHKNISCTLIYLHYVQAENNLILLSDLVSKFDQAEPKVVRLIS